MTTNTGSTPLAFSPYDYVFHEDPYPTYARLRTEAPVFHNAEHGFWALSRYDDVAAAIRDSQRLSSANGVSLDPAAYGPHAHRTMSFLAMDNPRHNRMRSLVGKGFTPRRVNRLEPRIAELTRQHLDAALHDDEFDFISAFAGKLPMDVISELMGVPSADRDALRHLADSVVHRDEGVYDVPEEAMSASLELVQYYADMLAERRRNPADDLTSALLEAEIDGDRLDDEEIIGFLFLMVVAGNETTTKLLGNCAYWGWRNPDELAKVLGDVERVPDWVEETLRYDNSTQMLARTATEDLEYYGRTVPAGDCVLLLVGSANRDENAFPEPDRFDIDRDTSSQIVSFGAGTHFCLGAHLARLEARIALTELVNRVADFDLDVARASRVHSSNVRGFAELPMSVRRR
ncbi:cytochrome P450 [Saccharopolyspora sp. HNM0983]|uniref:Cytochrome P450 n=1 Tax=Saccharopolyspora montiporae TaxID=2781240 RepID=A0A929B921_9PSEU|nr:cytochrome P450 [Saccharopolyspora sp. HNM0983]MBE9373798.1 cytochrome P450 [Saccharopolyspora sp. HNM0983]